jgi:hypothetical protein
MNTNINKNYLLTPVLIQNKSIDEINSPDIIEIDSDLCMSIYLDRFFREDFFLLL